MKYFMMIATAIALSVSMPAMAHHKDVDHGNSSGDKPDNPNKGPGNNNAGGLGKGHEKNATNPGHSKHDHGG